MWPTSTCQVWFLPGAPGPRCVMFLSWCSGLSGLITVIYVVLCFLCRRAWARAVSLLITLMPLPSCLYLFNLQAPLRAPVVLICYQGTTSLSLVALIALNVSVCLLMVVCLPPWAWELCCFVLFFN